MRRERPCPVNGCRTWIGTELMCCRHWQQLPDSIVAAIHRAQRVDGKLESAAYRAACRTAVAWLNRKQTRYRRDKAQQARRELQHLLQARGLEGVVLS